MARNHRVLLIVALVAIVAGVAAVFSVQQAEDSRVSRAVSAYLTSLSQALRELDPAPLAETASSREIGRVANYLTLLQGTGTSIEADLLELDVRTIESQDSTVTALVYERWRETEREVRTGLPKGPARERTQLIRYTLVPEGGNLRVYLSEIVEGEQP